MFLSASLFVASGTVIVAQVACVPRPIPIIGGGDQKQITLSNGGTGDQHIIQEAPPYFWDTVFIRSGSGCLARIRKEKIRGKIFI